MSALGSLRIDAGAAIFGSGRDAIAALARWGSAEHGWRRLWLPSYFCPEVPAALLADGAIELRSYPDSTLDRPADLASAAIRPGDAVLLANQLGARARPDLDGLRARGAALIEDHSHDLHSAWARDSDADYVVASLRKTLPIPDGGAVWSPRGLGLPPEPAGEATRASRLSTALEGRSQDGDSPLRYRALARAAAGADEPVRGAPISAVSRALLAQMPMAAWRERRRENLAILGEAVEAASVRSGVRLLHAPPGGVAFALTLVFETAVARERATQALLARAVVPAILWPLQAGRDWGAGPADADFSERVLSVHGDQRFDVADMRRLAELLRTALTAGSE
ncbi:MAG: hypothetical protein U0838_15735 [Chloroflexota bacterium]